MPNKQPYTKPALTIPQQIAQLRTRGMDIGNIPLAEHYLSQINYYRLSAYWLPFESNHGTHAFQAGTSFEQVLDLYIFDRELRLLVLDAIERVEIAIRTQLAYQLGHRYGTHPHLNAALFKQTNPAKHWVWDHAKSVSQLEKDANDSKETFIKHLLARYAEPLPPIWAAVEIMTLGQLSKWYDNLQSGADRNLVAHVYDCDETNLASFLHHLSTVRNLCAHHSRLWNREFIFTFKLPRQRPPVILSSFNPNEPRRIHNTLVMLVYLMNQIAPGHLWRQRLIDMLNRHHIDPARMGFPSDWKIRAIWR
jgi:abortive infection bacteriophage resistance protein